MTFAAREITYGLAKIIMKIEQIYTGCLAEATYYIESKGEAVIIDPLRETRPYLDRLSADHAKLKYILETHFHADFVSGHYDLGDSTGATIVFGPTAKPARPAHVAFDGEELKVGDITIKVLHTPGHTLESVTYLLRDEQGKEHAVFTGDTLFVGDVGRPDLVQKLNAEITPQYLAGLLYDSLQQKIMTLQDEVIVYPGHGAGSACGKKMDKETISTIGHQKKYNYALRPGLSRSEFVREVIHGLTEPPQYFPHNVLMNIKGYTRIDEVIKKGTTPLSPAHFKKMQESRNVLVLDTRSKEDFPKDHIAGSIFIGIDDSFAPWVGTLIDDLKRPIVIVADEGRAEEVVTRLARVGYDCTEGFLRGGMNAWKKAGYETESLQEVTAEYFAKLYGSMINTNLLDVRRKDEYDVEHVAGAENFPLEEIGRNMPRLDNYKTYYIYCAGGYRSLIAASLLKARGFKHVVNIQGGYKSLRKTFLDRTNVGVS